ncbi:hypothetical protein ASC64_20910 [Nocardioides sp. Root122]|uniref:hypothetical protein n=1 Tax=Nocardioides TaxID=1839 RepID=UPI0007028FC7|nr:MULTISPECIES: hypothetical protein [Nocardioides]KQV72081.1 hypothetical protein ASC64_20910 [Nocardioides sp. Root122]MCK9824713.1 hypothetical protein [Nocardioides cavernae]
MHERDEGDAVGAGRRTWLYVMALAWAFFGLATMVDGRMLLGAAQLLLAAANLAAAWSPRFAAFVDAPLLRRK